nr:hypothetical protein [Tanacetum cinerariifolium]
MTKTSCALKNVESKLKRKRRKRKSSKQNDKQVNNDVSRANSDFVHFSDLDTFSSVRIPKHSSVIWKKKGSSNTSNVDLSSVSYSKLNKDVKRYSRKDLLSCNNSHLGETSSAYVCNDAMNVSCNSRLCDSFDENNLFFFDDESVKKFPVSKMPFRKKPRDSLNVYSKHCPDLSLDYRFEMFKAYNRCYLLNDYDDVGKLKEKRDIGVFVGYSKDSVAFRIYNKRTQSSSSSLNDDVQQSSEEVRVPSSNTQSISNNMIPNADEASTSHNVFNDRLEDSYFDASTSFLNPSNVHTFYQPYPYEKNSIEPANVAEALKDADWVSAMQEELDQFARLKLWRLVPRLEGKFIIKTK